MPTLYSSRQSTLSIVDAAGTARVLTPYVLSIDGIPGERELLDVTALGDVGHRWLPDLQNGRVTIELLWSDDAGTGSETVFGGLFTDTTARALTFGPRGSGSGNRQWLGNVFVRLLNQPSRVGNALHAMVEVNVDGTWTRGTF